MSTERITLACLDMAGTTVRDDGAVLTSFAGALDALDVTDTAERARMLEYVRQTMGMSKIVVFRSLFGDEQRAAHANAAFEATYGEQIAAGAAQEIPGALEMIDALRDAGVKVALLTGFSKATQMLLVDALGWREHADLFVCPADAGRGRPYPDMVLHALCRLEAESVHAVAVAGDTAADVVSGRRAGASIVAGVLTGADDPGRLHEAGASVVLDSITELLPLIKGIS